MPRVLLFATMFLYAVPCGAAEIDFAHEIAPLLKTHCGKCHTGDQKKGGFSLNDRGALLAGGESGPTVVSGKSASSELIKRLTSSEPDFRMPPEGARVPAAQVALLSRWIDAGLPWTEGFSFAPVRYEPPLRPRMPELPPVVEGRDHPVDRILDAYFAGQKRPRPAPLNDAAFLRRAHFDLIGLLPTPEELAAFQADTGGDKRGRLVDALLARNQDYAEHWLSFWNDLLRNDYSGTGFITGGRKQITSWLYASLASNKPYDQMARELIAPPNGESEGFIQGIRWRGDVSAGQTVEIQFAQSVGQAFLGINLKCASCHDSFIDRWKLSESYALAAVYSTRTLDIHRCDKPTGQTAQAGWLFPELGNIDPKAAQPERLKQLAALLTHAENGRFSRTMVNRLWMRLMGRGLVHPADAMQTEPWHADLLDWLAADFAAYKYDLKHTLRVIATSAAYQSQAETLALNADSQAYVYAGPRAKRLTAEQFIDAVWQLTGTAPTKIDAPVVRMATTSPQPSASPAPGPKPLSGKWIWTQANAGDIPAGETVYFRWQGKLKQAPTQALAVVTCDNSYTLYVNGQKSQAGENWESPDAVLLTSQLKVGDNDLLIAASNGGSGPNPAGLFFEARLEFKGEASQTIATNETWQWTRAKPNAKGRYPTDPGDWKPAALAAQATIWMPRVEGDLTAKLMAGTAGSQSMVRASLMKSDFLMRALGRPNRDQIVSVRPNELTTLEAIDLANGQTLADALASGGARMAAQPGSAEEMVTHLFRHALSRDPQPSELALLVAALGDKPTPAAVEDVLWSIIMMPEFLLVR